MFIIIVTKTEYKEINIHLYLITKHSYNIFIIMIVKIWYRKKSNNDTHWDRTCSILYSKDHDIFDL
jgi:hypothetical protein